MSARVVVFASVLSLFVSDFAQTQEKAKQLESPIDSKAIDDDIILRFPNDQAVGTLWSYDPPIPWDEIPGYTAFGDGKRYIGLAQGEVPVPEDAFVGLSLFARKDNDDLFSQLPTQGIDRLEVNGVTVTAEVLRRIEGIETLQVLWFWYCEFDPQLDPTSLKGLPALKEVYCQASAPSGTAHMAFVSWAAKCQHLQYIYAGASLNADELRMFTQHQSPLFVSVSLGKDANDLLDVASQIPNLIGLNIRVFDDAPGGCLEKLGELKNVHHLNWSGGVVDADFVASIHRLDSLNGILVQGNTQITDDFVAELPRLQRLRSLGLRVPLSPQQSECLQDALVRMPTLRALPRIQNPSGELLEFLSTRTNLTRIELSGSLPTEDGDYLLEIIRSNKQLEWLILDSAAVSAEFADALCECHNLKYLSLIVNDFDGRLFEFPEGLDRLTTLSLNISGQANAMHVLSRLPKLSSLQISLATRDPNAWSFIGHCPSLVELEINEGYCDDQIAGWIRECKTLQSLSCHEAGVLTDRGVQVLSQCDQLERISIGGFIHADAIAQLVNLPRLQSLRVASDLLAPSDSRRLRDLFRHLRDFHFGPFRPSLGLIRTGEDGLYRQDLDGGRADYDAMEGAGLVDLLGERMNADLASRVNGKVVIIDFWGTWCGPCLAYLPELRRLHGLYSNLGLEVLAVHSMRGSETVAEYLDEHPEPWVNLVDGDGSLQNRFSVPHFPSLYVVGRDGRLRIALAHRLGLERSIQALLDEN